MSDEHMTPRKFLAKELGRARERTGMSTTDVAKAVHVVERLVRYWEDGKRLPQPDTMLLLDDLYGTHEMLTRMRRELVKPVGPIEWFGRWTEIEGGATAIYEFEPCLVSGLLQTEDYARVVLRAGNQNADVEEMLSARLERQNALTKEDPPMFVFVIAESALRHKVGSRKIMHQQMLHLADMAERDNVVIHVIPASKPACADYISGFLIAEFNGSAIAYVDNQLNGQEVEDIEDVAKLRRSFDVFRGYALDREESIEFIRRMAEEWKP
jgi:transcriptional regulator with XRE-family HTH domain